MLVLDSIKRFKKRQEQLKELRKHKILRDTNTGHYISSRDFLRSALSKEKFARFKGVNFMEQTKK